MRNVVFDDNRNIGRLNEKFIVLGIDVDAGFERFALDYIGYMTLPEIRSYTAGFVKMIEEQRSSVTKVYSPQKLTHDIEILFDSLFKAIENSLYDELETVSAAINSKPETKTCWVNGKAVICKLMNAVGAQIDEILKYESRHYQRIFDKLLDSISGLPVIFRAAYGKCMHRRLDKLPEERKKCAAFNVRIIKYLLTFYRFLLTLLDEGEKQNIFA